MASVGKTRKVGRWNGLTDIKASELGVGAFGLVVVRCHCWERAACFVDFGHWIILS